MTLVVKWCAGALLSRTLYVLALKSLPKLEKNNNNNQKDENTGVRVSWRLTTLAKLFVEVSDVFNQELNRKGLQ